MLPVKLMIISILHSKEKILVYFFSIKNLFYFPDLGYAHVLEAN